VPARPLHRSPSPSATLLAFLAACAGVDSREGSAFPREAAATGVHPPLLAPLGVEGAPLATPPAYFDEPSVRGRRLPYWVLGAGRPVTLVLGAIHGGERSGAVLAFAAAGALEALDARLLRGTIVFAPVTNPDGYVAGSRGNARNIDLNRNFPAANWGGTPRGGPYPASEPETRFILRLLSRFRPERVVSIHAALACVNYDGPALEFAQELSRATGLPVRGDIGYPTPGSLGSFLGNDMGVPTITLELRHAQTPSPSEVDGLVRVLLALHELSPAPDAAPIAEGR